MSIVEWIEKYWQISPPTQWKLFLSILILVVLWALRYFAMSIIFNRISNLKERYHWKNGVKNIYYIVLLVSLSALWVDRIESLATFLGLVTAGLAIALKDPLVNIAGWLFILIRKPFEVGDRIEINGFAGDVIDVRFFQFTLNEIKNWVDAEQSTGRIVHIPNGQVFNQPQANYTQGFRYIWHEIGVMVTLESNWKKAKALLLEIVNRHAEKLTDPAKHRLLEASKQFMIFYTSLTPTIYTSVKDSGVMLTIRYLVDPKNRRGTEHLIWEDVLIEFAKESDIDFAYPTQRIYYNLQEGKAGTVKPPNYKE